MVVEKKKEKKSEIPTASMADIAFLLLTFFLVTTTIDIDKGIGLVLPPKGEAKEVSKKNITNLLINEAGSVMIDEQITDIRNIKNIIRDKIANNPNIIVSVKTDERTKYQYYIQVLDQLKQANAKKISIAEPEK
jgi:biopolymer transport protein ExbD